MTKAKKYVPVSLVLFGTVFIFVSVLRSPAECAECAGDTLRSLYENVLPVLFPFMAISGIITELRLTLPLEKTVGALFPRLFRLPRCVSGPFLLGAICSFPVGAAAVTDTYREGKLTKSEAECAAALASVTGPSFPVAVVGTLLLGNVRTGLLIYIVQLLTAFAVGIPFCRLFIKESRIEEMRAGPRERRGILSVISDAISSAATRCVAVCGTVLFFSLFCDRLVSAVGITGKAEAIVYSLFEFSEGCRNASAYGGATGAAICAFAVSFGGLSVVAQSAAIMGKAGLSAVKLALFKLICGAVSAFAVFALTSLFDSLAPSVTTSPAFLSLPDVRVLPQIIAALFISGIVMRIRHLILRPR